MTSLNLRVSTARIGSSMPLSSVMLISMIALASALTVLTLVLLRGLPEPDDPDASFKISYRDLVDVKFVVFCMCASVLLGFVTVLRPEPIWLVYGSSVLVLVACDARTTWLPNSIMHLCWGLTALALIYQAFSMGPASTVGPLLGAACLGLFFFIAWRLSGSLGFGDVRLSLLVGATAGTLGLDGCIFSLLFGTIAAAVWGLVTAARRKRKPSPLGKAFPYGPGLWLGPYLGFLAGLLASA